MLVVDGLGLSDKYLAVPSAVLGLLLLIIIGTIFKGSVQKSLKNPVPSKTFSLSTLVEMIMDFLYNLTKEQCGHKYRKFLPFLSTIFLFILVINLTGMIPGFPPATENMSTNVAIGAVVFLVYNIAGLKENGMNYLKHFLGPVMFIAPLYLGIEIFSHMSRPLSLGLRLLGNIYGDHLLLAVFSGLVPLIAPVALLFFGLLVAAIQSFVFTLLTGIYISMAISHD
jgi:F-type H+-transporting ATPase subunit a